MMRTPALRIVFLIVLMDLAGFGLILPILPLYVNALGGSPLFIGALLSSYSLAQFAFNPVWGRLSDRLGRRPIILMSLTGSMLSYLAYGGAEFVSGDARIVLAVLLVSRLLAGAMGANIATAQAVVADVTTVGGRAAGMGMIGAAIGLGFVLGPAMGALFTLPPLSQRYGLGLPGFVAAGIALANLLWALRSLPETLDPENRRRAASLRLLGVWQGLARRHAILLLVGAMFLLTLAFSQFEASFSLLAGLQFTFGPSRIGLVFAYIALVMVFMQGVATRLLVSRLGERRVALLGAGLMSVAMAGVAATDRVPLLLLWLGVLGVGFGATQPTLLGMLSQRARGEQQGVTLGLGQAMGSLARIAGPILGMGLFGGLSMRAPFWAAALMMAGVLLATLSLRAERERPA
ncbi:MAG: MFS transporter [Candidatus Lambdaproteobacteria bacterium]|nr:MFS transporter [Candidatus Lambdaproteobacteria bacterium]